MSSFHPIPDWEIVIENKFCKHCNENFPITDKDIEFYEKVSPVFNGKKYSIPTPTLCPECREKRRLAFRNERNLYTRKCDVTGKSIISIYSPDKLFTVYDQKEWWSDRWDSMDYGKNFDFNKGFFEQFWDIIIKIPQLSLLNTENENCGYNNFIKWCKDCYLSSVVYFWSENIFYSNRIFHSHDIFESYNLFDSERCFECTNCVQMNNCKFLINCMYCSNSEFCMNCNSCTDCFMCTNLSNKKFCMENKQYTKEKYFQKIKEFH